MPLNTSILSPISGVVKTKANQGNKGYGKYVTIENSEYEVTLAHLFKFSVDLGEHIKVGQEIGKADSTGFSTGHHLHLTLKTKPIQNNNGYFGAVDPEPYLGGGDLMPDNPFPHIQDFQTCISELKRVDDERSDLNDRLQGCRGERKELKERNKELEDQNKLLEEESRTKDEEIISLKNRLKEEMETDVDWGTKLREEEEKRKKVEAELELEQKRVAVAKQELEKQNELLSDTQTEVKQLREHQANVDGQIKILVSENERLSKKLAELEGGEEECNLLLALKKLLRKLGR
jgi:hypothetical protein